MASRKSYQKNTPILITFFVRYKTFEKVFKRIREVKPPILFLASDGPRSNFPNDIEMIKACRDIAKNIDWDCEVFRLYSETNLGLLKNTFNALDFAFSKVDRLIFLEDDILPSQSFFPYCAELLEKYENDERIHFICGMNHEGISKNIKSDYFFSQQGSIWGFALWKRTYDSFDRNLDFLADKYSVKLLEQNMESAQRVNILKSLNIQSQLITIDNKCNDFELLAAISMLLNNRMLIIPTRNLIHCMGISDNAAHNVNSPNKLPKVIRNLFNMETYEINSALRHPIAVSRDRRYEKLVINIMGKNDLVRFFRRVEGIIRRIWYK